jgi:hypothetical protein
MADRHGKGYKAFRRARERIKRQRPPCYPRSTHPQHTLDPAGFRASHKRCNGSRGNDMPTGTIGTPTRKWLA